MATRTVEKHATISLAGAEAEGPIRRLKVLAVGNAGVGKSCLIKRYCEGRVRGHACVEGSRRARGSQGEEGGPGKRSRERRGDGERYGCGERGARGAQFVARYVCTIGVDYGVKPATVAGETMRVNFWDVSGHPSFADVRTEFYRDTEGALLVFDVGDRDSFTGLDAWLAEMKAHGLPADAALVLVGNKSDRARREVTADEARAWALDRRIEYFETSAESGAQVAKCLEFLFEKAARRGGKR